MINLIKFYYKKLNKKEKRTIFFIVSYITFVVAISFFYLYKIDFIQLISLDYFKNFLQDLDFFYLNNKIVFILLYLILVIIWVLLLSFMSPVTLLAGYIFGTLNATIIVSFAHAIAATILFVVVKFFFKSILKKIVTKKLREVINFLNKNINHYFLFYRIMADFGVPPPLHNLIPIFTKIKANYYFVLTFVGLTPAIFAWAYFGQSLRYMTELDEINFSILSNPNIYIPIILLGLISLIPLVIKKIMFKTKAKKK